MKTNWQEYVQLAEELIGENSRTVYFLKMQSVPADPDKPWLGTRDVQEERAVEAVFVPIGSGLGTNVATEEMLKRVDLLCLVAPTVVTSDCHKVRDGVTTYKIEWAQELRPGDTLLLTYLGLKR